MPRSTAPPDYAVSDEELNPSGHVHNERRVLEVVAPALRIITIILAVLLSAACAALLTNSSTLRTNGVVVWIVALVATWLSVVPAVYHTVRHRRSKRLGTHSTNLRHGLSACLELCLAISHWVLFCLITLLTRSSGWGQWSNDADEDAGKIMLGTWISVFISFIAMIHTLLVYNSIKLRRSTSIHDKRCHSYRVQARDEPMVAASPSTVQNVVGQRPAEVKQGGETSRINPFEDSKFGGSSTRISIDTL